jgi:LacI family transcriptional regulator
MRRRKKVSQQKIARDLGVSQALVSLTLNGRKEGISAATYQRIWDHAISLGYQPKGMVLDQSPVEARLRQVGIILRAGLNIHTQGSYFSHVFHGLHTALARRRHAAVFLGSEDSLDRDQLTSFFHTGHSLRGVALFGEVAVPFLNQLRALERRIVAISARHTGLCHSVVGNEPQALDSLVEHLQSLGHQRLGWLGGNLGLGRHESRFRAFLDAVKARGLETDARFHHFLKEADKLEGVQAMEALLPLARRREFPTAFVAYNTHMASGAILALQRAGWKVPEQVSIAGADNYSLAREESPRITVAGTDPEKLGEAAARLMLDSTGGADESFHDLTLPSQLVVGQSTGPAPA